MHSLKSRRRKEGPCQAPVPPLRRYQAPALPLSSSQRPQPYDHSKSLIPPQPEAEASVTKDMRIWRSSLQGSGSSHVRRKSQCEISSLSASCNLIGLDVRRALEIALFISLVNRSALYATRNDPRPQMITKIDRNTTRNDPRPKMIPKFFHTRPEMIPDQNGMGWRLIPEDARITRIKWIKEFWLELFEGLIYLYILNDLLNNYNSFLTNFSRNFRV